MGNEKNGQGNDTAATAAKHRAAERCKIVVPESLGANPRYQAASSIVRTLREARFEAYFVGGFVRDLVLATAPQARDAKAADAKSGSIKPAARPIDIDIASSADPAEIRRLFRNSHFVGQIFGVSMVDIGEHCFEVATFRNEGTYSDGRRPDSVTKGVLETDACRRDFTVNALYFDPLESTVLDFHQGIKDAQQRIIRTVGNPDLRFAEDRLRIIRMCRFASILGFSIEPTTWKAAALASPNVTLLTRERILLEIKKTPGYAAGNFLGLLQQLHLDQLLWQIPFDTVPLWQKNPESRQALESLVEHESHYPAAFILIASWENFLQLDPQPRKLHIAERQSWPTTVQDRKLLASLLQLVILFDHHPAAASMTAREAMLWSLAFLAVCQKLTPLTGNEIRFLTESIVAKSELTNQEVTEKNAYTEMLNVALAAAEETEQSAGEFLATRFGEAVFSKGEIVSLVHRRAYDARSIGFLLGLVRLTAASVAHAGENANAFTAVLMEYCSHASEGSVPDPALLVEYFSLLTRIR